MAAAQGAELAGGDGLALWEQQSAGSARRESQLRKSHPQEQFLGLADPLLGVSVSILTASCRSTPPLRGERAFYVFNQSKLGNCKFSLGLAN